MRGFGFLVGRRAEDFVGNEVREVADEVGWNLRMETVLVVCQHNAPILLSIGLYL